MSAWSHCPRRGFEDLCLLGNRDHPQGLFSRADRERTHQPTLPQGVSLTFTCPRPVGQQLSSNHSHLHSVPSSYSYYNTASSPCSSKPSLSTEHSTYPPPFRDTHVAFLLLQQFSSQLETEVDLMPAALIKLINWKADANEPGPGWMWVLAMGYHEQVRLPSIPHFWHIGLLLTG